MDGLDGARYGVELFYPGRRREVLAVTNRRFVGPHPDGGWQIKAPGADRASSRHETQREAEERAKEIVTNLGGGEVTIQDRHGRIRDSDTVPPGNDPNPPRDRKH